MHDASFLSETLIFLIAAVIVAPVFQRLRSSLVLGYLVAGVIIGPGVLSLISSSKQVNNIAELGIVFLLFTIGLELSVDRLKVIRNQIFGVGTAQVVVTSIIIATVAWSFGFSLQTSVIIGGGLALSSTAVVLQLLSERGELRSRRGRLTFVILLLQDLAVVPLLALVPAFAGEGEIRSQRCGGRPARRCCFSPGWRFLAGLSSARCSVPSPSDARRNFSPPSRLRCCWEWPG
jgi:CPA2 family monovalent cation:H+ antiporter-2